MNDGPHVLLIEDTPLEVDLATTVLSDLYPGVPIVVVDNWMDAIKHIRGSVLVVIDWLLSDGVTAADAGALDILDDMGIPHFVWTGKDDIDPDVGCPVIHKGNGEELLQAVMALKAPSS